jgi:hypothetical protein
VADTTYAAMSRAHAAAMSATHTGTNTGSCPATSSSSPSGAAAPAATATPTSEQRPRRCDQQCRYGGYCKKLGYPRHDDLLFAFNSAADAA